MYKLGLHWLAPRKASTTPVSFGTPWAKGALLPEDDVSLQDDSGNRIPAQTKINAYWPDGSVKWLLHSAVLDTGKSYSMEKGEAAAAEAVITAHQTTDDSVIVESDLLVCTIRKGKTLISSLLRMMRLRTRII